MIVKTESTPNPDTLKFLPGQKVSEVGSVQFLKSEKSNQKVPLADKILSIKGTTMVFLGKILLLLKKKNL